MAKFNLGASNFKSALALAATLLLGACATPGQPVSSIASQAQPTRQAVCQIWGYDEDASYCAPTATARTEVSRRN